MNNSIKTPIGTLYVSADKSGVCSISKEQIDNFENQETTDQELVNEALKQLKEYFNKEITSFSLPISRINGTSLQQETLIAVEEVPYGQTSTYKKIAAQTSNPLAIRAVAKHVANNSCTIIVPCHRIIHSNKNTPKYTWGSEIKTFLLEHEKTV